MSGAGAAGASADRAIEDLRSAQAALERDLLRILLTLDTESGTDSLIRGQGQTAAAVYRQISARLEEATGEVIDITGRRALEAVEAVAGTPPSNLSLDVRAELDQIVDGQAADVVRVFGVAQRQFREAVARGVLSSGSLVDVVQEIQAEMAITYRQAQAAVDAAVMAVGRRSVMAEAAALEQEEGIDLLYLYVGPRDAKNRPFCREWVGKAVTNPDRLDNGQNLPVEDFCGGYNCRHSWAPLFVRYAVENRYQVFDTSGPSPIEITDTLREQFTSR